MSINDATSVASASTTSSVTRKVAKTLSNNIIVKTIHQMRRKCYKCHFAKSYDQLPSDDVGELLSQIVANYTGPDEGICDISLVSNRLRQLRQQQQQQQQEPTAPPPKQDSKTNDTSTADKPTAAAAAAAVSSTSFAASFKTECLDSFYVSGLQKWNKYHHRAYGIACSLYENNPVTQMTVGEPVADTFAILARKNSSIMVLADGVNWGPRSRLAARCACRAAINHINKCLFFSANNNNGNGNGFSTSSSGPRTTHDIFKVMMRAFDAAQEFILHKKGTMTTLCCSVVVKLKDSSSSHSSVSSTNTTASSTPTSGGGSGGSLYAVLTLSIGDSTAYVFNRERGVFELTLGARNIESDRDMRNVGGALGHVYGNKPDVSNLNYSVMYVRENDIVFLVSDGISDNLDPVVSQTAQRPQHHHRHRMADENNGSSNEHLSAKGKLGRSVSHLNQPSTAGNNHIRSKMMHLISSGYNGSNYGEAKEAIHKSELDTKNNKSSAQPNYFDDLSVNLSSTLPVLTPYERYICSLAHTNEILLRNKTLAETISAQEVCAILIEHVMKLTAEKRDVLEKGLMEASTLSNDEDRLKFQTQLRERVQKLAGKLDHASIVAYEVGYI